MIGRLRQPNMKFKRATGIAAVSVSILLLLSLFYLTPGDLIAKHVPKLSPWSGSRPKSHAQPLPLPDDYNLDQTETAFCQDRFSSKYLTDLRDTTIQYCSSSSYSNLTCFHSHTSNDDQRDSFCIGKGSVLEAGRFALNCQIRQPDGNETEKGVIPFDRIRQYWYDTGPRYIFDKYVNIDAEARTLPITQSEGQAQSGLGTPPRLFTLLLKREGEGNPWHCLMEIWSMAMTIDVLRMTPDPTDDGNPFFTVPGDIPNTQVVILDERQDGPYFDLWKLFSGRDPIRLKNIEQSPDVAQLLSSTEQRIIVPLAGGSNPMWQNDWDVRDCMHSETLKAFVHRVLNHYNVLPLSGPPEGSDSNNVIVTFVDRGGTGTRKLKDRDQLLAAVKERFPDVEIEVVDFAAIPFAEQLRIAQKTDVLVGIHGAGLTHTMFLREGVTAVVEIQPSDMGGNYMGFRNLANMRDVGYFRAHANPIKRNANREDRKQPNVRAMHDEELGYEAAFVAKRASWHTEDFEMDRDSFVDLVGIAVKSLYSKNLREHDVV